MKKFLGLLTLLLGMATAQEPIIRVMQIGDWSTPAMWWKDSVTQDLDVFLAESTSKPAEGNNNFDIWRDKVLEMEVTLDDKGADVTTFRIDIAFDNDLITWVEQDIDEDGTDETTVNAWSQGNSQVIKGSHISGWTEGDESSNADYSFEVVHYTNVGYQDSLAATGQLIEESIVDNRYDWLRITMVSHGVDGNSDGTPDKTFGGGDGVQKQLLKFKFKINDVVDNFAPKSFRVATQYDGAEGYYTYVSDDYLLDYKVYIDGNWGDTYTAERTFNGAARGDITLHPKLVDIEGYYRYIGEWLDADKDGVHDQDGSEDYSQNKYAMWKVIFELDESNPDEFTNWLNLRDINYPSSLTDEGTTDDVMGTYDEFGTNALGYHHMRHYEQSAASTSDQKIQNDGFNGVSFWYWTYTDDKGYFNISLPRNNRYRVSFWPPDSDDIVGDHTTYLLDRDAVTNINDAIAGFNFQSNKFDNETNIEIESPSGYLVGDVDGDDRYQLNDAYFLWAYTSGVFDTDYTHFNSEEYQSWASIDNLKNDGDDETLNYYQTVNGVSRLQKREFSIFVDDDLAQETAVLTTDQGGIIRINPLMDDVQTGLDTLSIKIGAGSSNWNDNTESSWQDVNPDYLFKTDDNDKQVDIIGTDNDSDIGYYFTGDVNLTGTKVDNDGTAITPPVDGTTFYRWGNGDAPDEWARIIGGGDNRMAMKSIMTDHDVTLSFPADSTVRVQSGEIIEVPLMITPTEGIDIAGFEFEVEFNTTELDFIDMKTGNLPGPWMTYVNVGEVEEGWQRVRFGGLDYSPGNAPTNYWINQPMNALKLLFRADFPEEEWTEAPVRFVGKYAAGNPNGDDLRMERLSGKVMVWNKYWAFGGGEPGEDDITYNYPNPFKENTKFQFFVDQMEHVKLYILNSNGQYIGTLLDEVVDEGIHTFDFTNQPSVWLPEVSVHENHMTLEPGVYIFVLQTENKLKANKFTVVK